jgi:hypothetical protein
MNVSSPKLLLSGYVNITILSLSMWTVFRKLSVLLLISNCCILSFGWYPGFWILRVDVSEHSSIFIGGVISLPAYTAFEVGTGCSKTSAHKIQPPGNHPKERIQQSVMFLPNVNLSVTRTNTILYRRAYWVRVLLRIDSDILNTAVFKVLWSRPKIPSYIIVSLVKYKGEVF